MLLLMGVEMPVVPTESLPLEQLLQPRMHSGLHQLPAWSRGENCGVAFLLMRLEMCISPTDALTPAKCTCSETQGIGRESTWGCMLTAAEQTYSASASLTKFPSTALSGRAWFFHSSFRVPTDCRLNCPRSCGSREKGHGQRWEKSGRRNLRSLKNQARP